MIFITSYQRPDMLLRLLKELNEPCIVIDDGSTYDPSEHMEYCDYYRLSHKGKIGFWATWNFMLEMAQDYDELIFLQDDLYNVDLEGLRKDYTDGVLNVLNVGGDRGWSPKGYVDCNFYCYRDVFDTIGWQLNAVDIRRFQIEGVSSGVGNQITKRCYNSRVPMYLIRNYADHGDHPSIMHPEHRMRVPLCTTISK